MKKTVGATYGMKMLNYCSAKNDRKMVKWKRIEGEGGKGEREWRGKG